MSATTTVTGHLGADPDIRFTQSGSQVITLRIGATATHHDKTTNEWVQDGDPLWIDAPFWGDQHNHLADILHKGDKVTVTGTLIRRDYTTRDGRQGTALELKFPTFLGKIDRQPSSQQQMSANTQAAYQNQAQTNASWGQPAGGQADDPWRQQPQEQQGQQAGLDYGNPPF
ncbi:single-stranded DNA-binding protein [Schaalia cardiffensis]|uniref:single-stranded DNA-binding protein n=1 Tax=Schaalia cardiffensis TaxID=181487 RepID=UPI0023F04EA0|nr:single-stranded DNA-binding protein [Schaalia cardiffensis]